MNLLKPILFSLLLLCSISPQKAISQSANLGGRFELDESSFYAMTKQMSQFFSRFNQEEDRFGKKINPSAAEYHNFSLRKEVLPLLFDGQNQRTAGRLRDMFIEDLTNGNKGTFMNFLGGKWYAEAEASFDYRGKTVTVVLFLMIEKEGLGSKWVLTNVYFPAFNKLFPEGELVEREKHFLHPMSHELDFMNIHKAFKQPEVIEYYASKEFKPDYLTLFFYEVKLGHLQFKQINQLKFHIFQIRNWYFEVSFFNRGGTNSGWLISNLMYVEEAEKTPLLNFYQPRGL